MSSVLRGEVTIRADDLRFVRLLRLALSRPPPEAPRIRTLRSITLSGEASAATVGLTRYRPGRPPRQTVTFYAGLLGALSDEAALGVIAHELAHVWLNEHSGPEDSDSREDEADGLARSWGFGRELDALDREAETVRPRRGRL